MKSLYTLRRRRWRRRNEVKSIVSTGCYPVDTNINHNHMKFQEKRLKCTTVEVIHVLYLLLLTPEVILFQMFETPSVVNFINLTAIFNCVVTGKVLAL